VTDEAQNIDEAPADEAQGDEQGETEYLEFLGTNPETHGTEFYRDGGTHTISRAHMKAIHGVDLGVKEAVWKRGSNGRFLVPVADLGPEAGEILAADPMFKRVTL
jgi:hypothetical protein